MNGEDDAPRNRWLRPRAVAVVLLALAVPALAWLWQSQRQPGQAQPAAAATNTPETVASPLATATQAATIASPEPRRPTAAPGSRQLTVCSRSDPTSLYLYERDLITQLILDAIYDGPIDTADYGYQPVILETLPSLEAGDAAIVPVAVSPGITVVNSAGEVVRLAPGTRVRPAGCRSSQCAVEYAGGALALDQIQVTFQLIAGVRWSDGAPVRASDSVFSFELARNAPDAEYFERGAGSRTQSYVATGDLTTVWTSLPGYVPDDYFLNFWTPMPQHAWANLVPAEFLTASAVEGGQGGLPLGYGPYQVTEWIPGDHLRLARNPYYFRAAEGLPYFDSVIIKLLPLLDETQGDWVRALEAGECDVVPSDVPLERLPVKTLEAQGTLRLAVTGGSVTEYLVFNTNPPDDRAPFFADARVRQALALCIDRPRLVEWAQAGLGWVPNSYAPPDHPAYAGDALRDYGFDPAAGAALLAEAGWQHGDGDGVREARGVRGIPDGTPLSFSLAIRQSATRQQMAELVAADLAACGVHAAVQFYGSEIYDASAQGLLAGRHFDAAEVALLNVRTERLGSLSVPTTEPGCEPFLSASIPAEGNGWQLPNFAGYSSPAYDAACQQALAADPAGPVFAAAHRQAQIVFNQDLPALPLWVRTRVSAARPDLLGFQPTPTENTEFWNIESWRLAP